MGPFGSASRVLRGLRYHNCITLSVAIGALLRTGGGRASHTNGARGATERIREPRVGEASRAQREVQMSADGEGEGRRDREAEWESERENIY